MPVDPRHVIKMRTKQGEKEFVLFVGLLDLGHQMGLRAIETKIVTEVCNPIERSWVVEAIGTFVDTEGKDRVWSAYGDASPANSQMRGAELRHAETRAAARMLRMATNCGITAFEELGPQGDESDDNTHAAGVRPNGTAGPHHSQPAGVPPAAPLPAARVSAAPVVASPGPGSPPPGQMVESASGAPRVRYDPQDNAERLANGEPQRPGVVRYCEVCRKVLTVGQSMVSKKAFGKELCPEHQRAAAVDAHTAAQSVNS